MNEINDNGVYININVVSSGDNGYTIGTNKGKEDLYILFIARFILDYADSAEHAIKLLKNKNILVL